MPDPGGGPSNKLSSRARQLRAGGGAGESAPDRELELLIRTSGEIGDEARGRLEAAGATVRTVAGDVLTASAPLSALDGLAELEEVVAIEVSEALAPEEPPHTDVVEGGG